MTFRIVHLTRYAGAEPISVGHNEAWLTPRDTPSQHCRQHVLEIVPAPSVRSARFDYFGNTVTQFSFNQGYDSLSVTAVSQIDIVPRGVICLDSPGWGAIVDSLRQHPSPSELAAYQFVFDSPRCRARPEFVEYAIPSFPAGRPVLEAAADLMRRFHTDFKFETGSTNVSTPVEQVFKVRRGVCQDFAHLMISLLRSLGLAARYVSGYLRTLPPPGKSRLVGADASHAWLSIYAGPAHGWVDLDPTNNQFPNLDHTTIAWGRDYSDVAPLKGVYTGGGTHQLFVSVDVAEVDGPGTMM